MSGTVNHDPPIRARWARRLIREKLAAEINMIGQKRGPGNSLSGLWSHDNLPTDKDYENSKEALGSRDIDLPSRKVCIVGAGVAGLYIAMILDDLNIPNLSYDILEANDRVGGRAYTYRFSTEPHDYYDIGAMRYPDIDSMARTFDLFRRTKMPLIDYHLKGPNTPKLYNDRFFVPGSDDPYHVSVNNNGVVPNDVVDNVDGILEVAFRPYREALQSNFDEGFKKLMTVDNFSTREFLKRGGPDGKEPQYGFFSIQWMETQSTSTKLFDQAFSESVIDSFDFDGETPWKCIYGGTSRLTNAMHDKLKSKAQTKKRVEVISMNRNSRKEDNMSVKCADEKDWREGYCTVFNTTALGCLGRMDLRGLGLHPSQKDAIRSLYYDHSVKVALKFKYPWWIKDCKITEGGVAYTDIPLRTCVYPSYNLEPPFDKPAVLLASYTWAQDAARMGSLVKKNSFTNEDELVELILRDLARLHKQHNITYECLKEALIVYHAYSWSDDPTTAGAFALFGPGQFSNLYPYLTRPAADSKFHIVGEASSSHHAWIAGALDSAYSAVYLFLKRFKLWGALHNLEECWGSKGEVAELEAGLNGTAHLQIMLGAFEEEYQFRV